jgi:hypothetical protein
MSANKHWHVGIQIDEHEGKTRALARLHHREELGLIGLVGVGLAQLNPADRDVPEIGVARALSDLSHQLLDAATGDIKQMAPQPIHMSL